MYITASKRLAQCTMNVYIEPTGNLRRVSEFNNFEPFQAQHDATGFWTEIVFYTIVCYFLVRKRPCNQP